MWPPSTKFSCGPTRARHKPPPAPACPVWQHRLSHLSPSDIQLPNVSARDFKTRLWAVGCGGPFRFGLWNGHSRTKPQETSTGCDLRRFIFLFLVPKENSFALRETLHCKSLLAFFLYCGDKTLSSSQYLKVYNFAYILDERLSFLISTLQWLARKQINMW